MSKFKVGDKVRAKETSKGNYITEGSVYEVLLTNPGSSFVDIIGDEGERVTVFSSRFGIVVEEPKGTFERLMIESLPQGGYKVTASGPTYAHTHNELAAFTTLSEATAFVGRNMR